MSEPSKPRSHQNKVDAYLKPTNHKFVQEFAARNEISKSQVINEAVRALKENQVRLIKRQL